MLATMIAAALLIALQPGGEPLDESPFSERQPVRLAPLPAARAFAAFRDICMASFPDPAAFDAGRGRLRSRLRPQRTRRARGEPEWTLAPRPDHVPAGASARRATPRQRPARSGARRAPALAGALRLLDGDRRARWSRTAGRGDRRAAGAAMRGRWRRYWASPGTLGTPRQDATLKLVYLPSTDDDPRLFTLSLQLLPANRRP